MRRIALRARNLARSDLGSNALWFTGLQVAERGVAVVQTVMLSRALGIHDFGIYGMLFATLGLVTSVAGLQAGLTATVFVSRYLAVDTAKVAGVISVVERFGFISGVGLTLILVPFHREISHVLLHQSGYETVTLIALLFIAASILSGIQDGIAQGFEAFRYLARLKLVMAAFVLSAIYPAAQTYGLDGVFLVILVSLVAKFLVLAIKIRALRADGGVPAIGSPVNFKEIMVNFAFPSLAVSLVFGWAMWFGLFLLSRGGTGFAGVAIVNVATQWRGPALLLTTSLSGVTLPRLSRYHGQAEHDASRALRRKLILVNGTMALLATVPIALAGPLLMRLYGTGFDAGALPFALILLSTVPTAIINVYMQDLVGAARMWRQLWLQLPYAGALAGSFFWLVPRLGPNGYAIGLLGSTCLFFVMVVIADRDLPRRTVSARVN